MIQIPDEVRNTALAEFESVAARSSVGTAVTATWRVIAEWARKEALREAAATAKRWSSPHTPYDSPAVLAILALAEGVRS